MWTFCVDEPAFWSVNELTRNIHEKITCRIKKVFVFHLTSTVCGRNENEKQQEFSNESSSSHRIIVYFLCIIHNQENSSLSKSIFLCSLNMLPIWVLRRFQRSRNWCSPALFIFCTKLRKVIDFTHQSTCVSLKLVKLCDMKLNLRFFQVSTFFSLLLLSQITLSRSLVQHSSTLL